MRRFLKKYLSSSSSFLCSKLYFLSRNRYNFWLGFIFVYQKSLKRTFKISFWVQNHLWICVRVLWIHKGYCVVKKQVWNVRIKAFWYTKYFMYSKLKSLYNVKLFFMSVFAKLIYDKLTTNYFKFSADYLGWEKRVICWRNEHISHGS